MKHTHSLRHARRATAIAAGVLMITSGAWAAQATSTNPSSAPKTKDTTTSPSTSTNSTYGADTTYGTSAQATTPSATSSTTSSGTYGTGAGAMTGRDTNSGMSSNKLGFMDRRFVTKAAEGGKDEVAIAELAAQRASNPDVKAFAEKLISDHTAVNSELTSLAGQKNVKLDNDDNKDRTYRRLSKASGMDFDQEFVEHMIDDHEKDIKMFEKASTDAKDSDVRSFAAKHVDHLKSHLAEAQRLRSTTMPTGRMEESSGHPDISGASTRSSTTTNPGSIGTKGQGSDRSGDYSKPGPSSSATQNSTSTTK